jgi:hypothetical protein
MMAATIMNRGKTGLAEFTLMSVYFLVFNFVCYSPSISLIDFCTTNCLTDAQQGNPDSSAAIFDGIESWYQISFDFTASYFTIDTF